MQLLRLIAPLTQQKVVNRPRKHLYSQYPILAQSDRNTWYRISEKRLALPVKILCKQRITPKATNIRHCHTFPYIISLTPTSKACMTNSG